MNTPLNKKPRAMVISLGGTPAPLIFSLNHHKPEFICFFVSAESKASIERDILPCLDFKPRHHDWIITPSAENLSTCYRAVSQDLPVILKKWEIAPVDIIVDYTGGTKTMSVALVLATIEYSSKYTYIGGVERTKEGLGIVVNGREKMLYLQNPWDELAVAERKEACLLFNRARYASAAEVFTRMSEKVSERRKAFFTAMKNMAEGYDLWDRFRHKDAMRKLHQAKGVVDAVASSSDKPDLISLSNDMGKNLQFLNKILTDRDRDDMLFCYDLLANAKRRADLENKFEDAVARLYRTIEAIGQFRLKSQYHIDTSGVKSDQIPDSLREEFSSRYRDPMKGLIRLPLYASYRMLEALDDDIGKNFFSHFEIRLKSILDIRNNSILAHGFQSVKKETFEKMYDVIIGFSGIKEEHIPVFPRLAL